MTQRAAVHMMQDTAPPEAVERLESELATMRLSTGVFVPAGLAVQWGLTATGLWAIAVLVGSGLSWRAALSVVAVSGGPELLRRMADLLVASSVGPEFRTDLTPVISSATSLAALFPTARLGTWGAALLDQISPFAVWTGALWAIGVRELGRIGTARAIAVAAPTWCALRLAGAALEVVRSSLSAAVGGLGP